MSRIIWSGIKIISLVVVLGVMSGATLVAKDKGGKGPKGTGGGNAPGAATGRGPNAGPGKVGSVAEVRFSFGPSERKIIQGYVNECRRRGKPGKNVGGLPPGLAKKVARGGELPPGWEKKCLPGEIMPLVVFQVCHPLPHALVVELPPSPPETTLVAVEGRVYRVHKPSRRIHAVFEVDL